MNALDQTFGKALQQAIGEQDNRLARLAIPGKGFAHADVLQKGVRLSNYTTPLQDDNSGRITSKYDVAQLNPFLVEPLLERLLKLLETCLVLRSQYLDYDALASNRQLDSQLFDKLLRLEEEEEAINSESKAWETMSNQRELLKGDASLEGSPSSVDSAKAHSAKLQALNQKRRAIRSEIQAKLKKMEGDEGSGLNYATRLDSVKTRFAQLLGEAAFVALALSDGLKLVYGVGNTIPAIDPAAGGFLDALVKWSKDVLTTLERILLKDVEYSFPVSLKTAKDAVGAYAAPVWNAVAGIRDSQKLGQDVIRFTLDPKFWFPRQSSVRLRGVAACIYGGADDGLWTISITPPKASVGEGATAIEVAIPRMVIGNVSGYLPLPPTFTGGAYYNLNPSGGEWEVRIERDSSKSKQFTEITDVEIWFRVAVIPQP